MPDKGYNYDIDQCDVPKERRNALPPLSRPTPRVADVAAHGLASRNLAYRYTPWCGRMLRSGH